MAWMHLLPSTSCVTQVAGHSDYFRKHLVLGAFAGGEGDRPDIFSPPFATFRDNSKYIDGIGVTST
jgi:hypothetical protein